MTACKSQTVTLIGGGNASGQQIPPYLIYCISWCPNTSDPTRKINSRYVWTVSDSG
ncbi:hypothetical protein DPMN_130298 [Dreissena polymorpha]|uniref:Uncharacterized protein n=1 Tax=Dreissena polymorpha TaxID=45954 RepID=A0A9D4H4X1_DREPO|nr:hypothetical protein DPMN_130298 [Dreissena polymorpha]